MVVLDKSFLFGRQNKWPLVALDRWSSYIVTTVWEFAWADSTLVILDEWSSYRGGCLSRFDCTVNPKQKNFLIYYFLIHRSVALNLLNKIV